MLSPFMSIAPRFLRVVRFWSVLGAVLSAVVGGFAQSATPSAADGYDPNVDGNVYAMLAQIDGKTIIAGQFARVQPSIGDPAYRNNLARLNADGSVDATFDPNANGPVRVVVAQADGKLLVGGDFTSIQPNGGAAVTCSGIVRLNSNGSLDTTFVPVITNSLQVGTRSVPIPSQVYAILVQSDGRIVVGGSFTGVQPAGATASTTRNRIARFNANGTLDTTFNPNADNTVFALAQHTGGKILVGGGFTQFTPNGATVATARNRIARLNVDGTVDTAADLNTGNTFDPNANNRVLALAVQRDGLILVAGDFTALQPAGTSAAANRSHLVRLNTDGSLDTTFNANASASVMAVGVQPDGRLLIGGAFNSVWSNGGALANVRFLARFNPDGTVDQGFNSGVNNAVDAFVFQPDGQLVVGGYFTGFAPAGAINSVARNRVARLNTLDGALDTTLNPDAGGRILVSAVQSDGKILIGGSFTSVGGATHTRMARLNTDGTVDTTFNPDFNERVFAITPVTGGKILVGGAFTTINGVTRNFIARLNADGTVDTSLDSKTGYAFDPNASSQVGSIVVQPDGKILLAGTFTTLTPAAATPTSVTRFYIARLNTDGTVDTTFDPNPNSTVSALTLQPDGKILVGGGFTVFQPNSSATQVVRTRMARLNADGTVDGNYDVAADDQVSLIKLQSDGKAIIAGIFSAIHGTNGDQTYTRLRLARLNADGTLDTTFDPSANAAVAAMAVQSDGKILIGGPFTVLTPNGATVGTYRNYMARLNADGTLDTAFDLGLNSQNGNRVDSITIQPTDNRILVAGTFVSLQPSGTSSPVARLHFARVTPAGAIDTTFQPGVGGNTGGQIKALAMQTDGKIIAAGKFSDLGGTTTTNIARLNPTGTADTSFDPNLSANGDVNAILLRPDATPSVVQGQGIAWLNANGTVHTAFSPDTNSRINGVVDAVARDAGGNVLIGGAFTTTTGLPGNNLLRFTPAGVIDQSFAPSPNGGVGCIVVQPGGGVLVSGSFTTIAGLSRNFIARFNPDGSIDSTFNPNPNARVNTIVLQPDGQILIGGAFTSLTPNNAATATTTGYVARLNPDGSLDTTFTPNVGGTVSALLVQSDGQVIIGGAFTLVTPTGATTSTLRNRIARVSKTGVLDTSFDPNFNDAVNTMAFDANGKLLVGGNFTNVNPNTVTTTTTDVNGVSTTTTSTPAITRNYLARLNSDGTVDTSTTPNFDPNANGPVANLVVQPNGQILIGGSFTTFQPNGASLTTTRNHLARLNADGSVDTNFNPNANNSVNILALQADGTIIAGGFFTALQPNVALYVGGAFTQIGGVGSQYIALLNNDGSVSSGFQPQPNNIVTALLAQPDGKIVVAGAFTNIAGATRNRLARFNADANTTLDSAFTPAINGDVGALALQPDGKIVICGGFSSVNGQARNQIARLNADGSLDPTFAASLNFTLTRVALQPDGRVLVVAVGAGGGGGVIRLNSDGSTDTTFNQFTSGVGIVSLALQSDGRILVGSSFPFPTPTDRILARLNADGTVDSTFNPGVHGNFLGVVALQPDGRVIVGGDFSTVGGLPRSGLARLSIATPSALSLAVNRTTVLWTRTGGGPELAGVTFDSSSDAQTWTPLGQAGRVIGTDNWQLGGLALPASGLFYIRARGLVPTSSGTSASTYQFVRQFNLAAVAGVGPADLTNSSLADDPTHVVVGSVAALPKVSGAASEILSDVFVAANHNTFDQVLLTGTSATITADPGQVTRLSFVDLMNNIVQVEFAGAGALSINLDSASGPATAVNYNQPEVAYMKGHAGIVITGADETTNVSIYSVGRLTAVNQTLFKSDVKYDGVANIGYLTIQSANGKFGGVRTANASYVAIQGVAGIRASGVEFTGPVYVGDINAADKATPMLLLGLADNAVLITGGDLWQANGQPVQVSGIAHLQFTDGMTSGGALLPAQTDQSRLVQNGTDVTAQVVVNPSP